MKKIVFCLAVFAASILFIGAAPNSTLTPLEKNAYSATALLYAQTWDGDMKMFCTATAFEKDGKVYRFLTAAHCVADDDLVHERVEVLPAKFFITFDTEGDKEYFPAKLVGVGYQMKGDDLAVLEVTLNREALLMPPASQNGVLGEKVINVAGPFGLGKQLFAGRISMERLDRPNPKKEAFFLELLGAPGSSGSAIVSEKQKGIIGVLVSGYGLISTMTVAIPIEKFKKFWEDTKNGNYRWFKPEEQNVVGVASNDKILAHLKKIHDRFRAQGPLDGENLPKLGK